jgi:hypothetical protein
MKSLIATAALTLIIMSAGAVASIGHNHPAVRNPAVFNVTVIHKNVTWPAAFATSIETCQPLACPAS